LRNRINAVFSWQVTEENTLNHPGIIQLPGKPLHLAIATAEGASPKIITAVDPGVDGKAKSLHVFTLLQNEGRIAVDQDVTVHDTSLEAEEMEVSEAEVRGLLYNTESLRKQSAEAEEAEEGVEPGEGAEAEAEAQEDLSVMEE
jgi:tRNA (guanine-N(7)-)-methyltransferase subunit TRM82